jgi:predicted DNA-binding mobile mystery protein A
MAGYSLTFISLMSGNSLRDAFLSMFRRAEQKRSMQKESRNLAIEQLDRWFRDVQNVSSLTIPNLGWLHAIRTALGMSYRQFAHRLGLKSQSAREMEQREVSGSITLKSLRQGADALGMRLVYVLVPKDGSLEAMLEQRAEDLARSIVLRTSRTMELEDQGVSTERLQRAIRSKTDELLRTMPRYLWD